MERKFDLDERLFDFAADIIDVVESLPKTQAGNHLAGQLIRSGTAPALHYGEAQGAESRADFIHKMKVALKELQKHSIA
ncbi:MAG: four helix bundle protein [Panacibacter sp.]